MSLSCLSQLSIFQVDSLNIPANTKNGKWQMEDDSHFMKAIYYLKRFIKYLFIDKKTSVFWFFLCHFNIGSLDF